MMRKLMGKFYFLITRIIKSAETRSFWRNFQIDTQYTVKYFKVKGTNSTFLGYCISVKDENQLIEDYKKFNFNFCASS